MSVFMSNNSINNQSFSEFPPVSWKERDARVQQLIDESFQTYVLPLHENMFNAKAKSEIVYINYAFVGSLDYAFKVSSQAVFGVSAVKIAKEFAEKERFSVLDLGTGNGAFLKGVKDRYKNVEVMGISAADFRPLFGRDEFEIPDKEYIVDNLENLSKIPTLQGKKFDFIVSEMTFRHLSDPLGVLCQAYEMLQPNGILIVDDIILYGLTGLEYAKLFEEKGYNAQISPETYASQRTCESNFRLPFDMPTCSKIRKTVEHLSFPVSYDLEKSTKATKDDRARIFYKVLSD